MARSGEWPEWPGGEVEVLQTAEYRHDVHWVVHMVHIGLMVLVLKREQTGSRGHISHTATQPQRRRPSHTASTGCVGGPPPLMALVGVGRSGSGGWRGTRKVCRQYIMRNW